MRRRSRASGRLAKGRSRKAKSLKAVRHSRPSDSGQETELERLTRELNEAREQQAATADVLNVISRSTFDLQAVLDTLVESAARLCNARDGFIFLPSGDVYRAAARYGVTPEYYRFVESNPIRMDRGSVVGRAGIEGQLVHVPDVLADPEYTRHDSHKIGGWRAALGVPLLREGNVAGVFFLSKTKPQAFTDKQVELINTFADQAVIALENARLLNELQQSLEQQTATADMLKLISRSTFDLKSVLNTLVESAARLCEADITTIARQRDGYYHVVAACGFPPGLQDYVETMPIEPGRGSVFGRILLECKPVQIVDVLADPEYTMREFQKRAGYRTVLGVPLLREGVPIGLLNVNRTTVRPFTDKQIELVTAFADQAAIAIENVRLLEELRKRTAEVEKLNQQLEQRVADQVSEIERMGRLRRFLPPQVADLIVASGTEKQLESHRREITALFCDLRGFTGFSESSDPEDVMALLRDYHAAIGEIVVKYSGTLERYAGDGIMVVFNDPVPVENPALQAVLTALEMRDAIGALTETWHRWGHDIGFGIGIAHGFATLGTIGFEGRFDYAAIGTVSNVASRLCDEAKPGQILISPRVLTKVENAVTVEAVGEFALKGIRRPMMAYNVLTASPSKPN